MGEGKGDGGRKVNGMGKGKEEGNGGRERGWWKKRECEWDG